MSISKSSAIAGALGTGGGAAGTVAIVKYATSKDSNQPTSETKPSKEIEATLDSIKEQITKWGEIEANGKCKIKVKLTSGNEAAKELNDFVEENKNDLKGLYIFLNNGSKNSDAKNKCSEAAKASGNKALIAKKGDSNNSWTFDKES